MASKFVFALCAQILQIRAAFGRSVINGNSVVDNNIVIGNSGSAGFDFGGAGIDNIGVGSAGISNIAVGGISGLNIKSSGPLLVTSISPIGPSGLAVASENVIQGNLIAIGQLPFLSAVAFDGTLPTAGSGVATCGCGSGNVGIVSEGLGGKTGGCGAILY